MIAEPELPRRLTAEDAAPELPVIMLLTEHWDS